MTKFDGWKKAYAILLLCAAMAIASPAQTLTTLVSFDGTNGATPSAGLVQGTDGNFYGTTALGGANGGGTVFKMTPSGTLTTLYSFCAQTGCTDGTEPLAGLVQATNGNFYGTTFEGGDLTCSSTGCGTVFEITPGGTLTTLHSFDGANNDGEFPSAGLVQATNGNLYGTTSGGDLTCTGPHPIDCGSVFEITPAGTLTTLYSFPGSDGAEPMAGLVQGTDGNFYGTTFVGGTNGGSSGTVFEITPGGTLTTLHSFDGADGAGPLGLVLATNGNFYGITSGGGANNNNCNNGDCGTVFEITPAGTLTTLYSFGATGGGYTGNYPDGLVQGTDGNFYGTTVTGAANGGGEGTIFEITPGGTLTVLYSFDGTDGEFPKGGLLQATNGNFYGTTYGNSTSGSSGNCSAEYCGTVFSLSVAPTIAATPSFSAPSGTYTSAQSVTISDATSGATIYYTTNGTTPTTASTVYTGAITVDSTETLEAIAAASGYSNSPVATATYTINLPPADFQLSVNPSALTIVAGQSGKATFTVTPENGFNSQVSFACSGLPAEASCSFDPTAVTPNGAAATSTLTISTTAASSAMRVPIAPSQRPVYALLLPSLAMIFGIAAGRRRALRGVRLLGLLILLMVASGLPSCGGGSGSSGSGGNNGGGNPGTPAGTDTVSVSASTSGSGAINHTATLTITITQ